MRRIKELIKHFFSKPAFRYLFFGGLSYVFEISVLFVLVYIIHAGSGVSVTVAFWMAFVFNFLVTKFGTFRNKSTQTRYVAWQSVSYGALVLFNYLFALFFVSIMTAFMSIVIARTISIAIQTTWNYFIYSRIIFKKTKN